MKLLKFTSNGVHVGFNDYGFKWKIGDEHEVADDMAKLAVDTFPTLFTIVASSTKKEDVVESKKVDTDKTDNKLFSSSKNKGK